MFIDGIARKMIHRHPHVFAGRHYDSVEQQQADWEKLKSQEEGHKQTSLKEEITLVPEVSLPSSAAEDCEKGCLRWNVFHGG